MKAFGVAVTIIVGNLIPLAGVLWLGWRADTLMLLYWAEAVAVGLFALLRVMLSGGGGVWPALLGLFFVGHYGTFCLGALALITAFFVVPDAMPGEAFWSPAFARLASWGTLVGLVSLAAPHAAAFIRWLRARQHRTARPSEEATRPYLKVFLMLVVAALCGWVAFRYGQPVWTVALLVAAKTASDLLAARRHLKQSSLSDGDLSA